MADETKAILAFFCVLAISVLTVGYVYIQTHESSSEGLPQPRLTVEECRALCAPNPVYELGGYPVTSGGSCRCMMPSGFHP